MEIQKKYYLLPSQIFVTVEDYQISTVLGSCIAICVWDSYKKIGGMNHYMLPLWNGNGLASPKYGNIAIEKLLKKMVNEGSLLKNIEAKIFGGGDVLGTESSIFNIGQRNIEIAYETLKNYNVKITAQSVGGENGRKIMFCTKTGIVKQKYVANNCFIK